MKRVTAIVRPEKMEPLKDALFAADVKGMTISQVHGCGAQHGWSEYVRGTEVMLNMVPKVKFEVVVEDDAVDALVDTIVGAARTGEVGDGKIFVAPVEKRCASAPASAGARRRCRPRCGTISPKQVARKGTGMRTHHFPAASAPPDRCGAGRRHHRRASVHRRLRWQLEGHLQVGGRPEDVDDIVAMMEEPHLRKRRSTSCVTTK